MAKLALPELPRRVYYAEQEPVSVTDKPTPVTDKRNGQPKRNGRRNGQGKSAAERMRAYRARDHESKRERDRLRKAAARSATRTLMAHREAIADNVAPNSALLQRLKGSA